MRLLSRHEQLDVGSTNINGQHFHNSTFCFLERGALGCDHRQQFVPGFYKRLRAFILKLRGQGVHVDAGLRKLGQDFFSITTVRRHDRANFAMIREGFQRRLGHRVHCERRGERFDVENIRSLRILGAGAGPEQTLRPGAGIIRAL